MMPAPPAPFSVIVNVYLPLVSLSLGYAEVRGLWGQVLPPVSRGIKMRRPIETKWRPLAPPRQEVWTKIRTTRKT